MSRPRVESAAPGRRLRRNDVGAPVYEERKKLVSLAEMAEIYNCPSIAAFRELLKRDEAKPPELREIPAPVNKRRRQGMRLRWSPYDVEKVLRGEWKGA